MGYYDLSREARFEFRRVAAGSLLESAQRELDRHRAAGHRLRARAAERRVAERRALLAGEDAPIARGGTLVAALTLTWLATVAALAAAILQFGLHGVTAVADVAMVAATVAWFVAIVMRVPPPEAEAPQPPPVAESQASTLLSLAAQYHGGSVRDLPPARQPDADRAPF
jgi:hypothetical protein